MNKKIEVFASEAFPGELEAFPNIKRGLGVTKGITGGTSYSGSDRVNF